jgi:flagellar biosynthesis/type III secretory pathway protein FliH
VEEVTISLSKVLKGFEVLTDSAKIAMIPSFDDSQWLPLPSIFPDTAEECFVSEEVWNQAWRENIHRDVENAHRQAAEVRAAAMEEAAVIRQQATVDGYQAGFQAGQTTARQEFMDEYLPLIDQMRLLVQDVGRLRGELYAKLANPLRDAVISMTERLLQRELLTGAPNVEKMVGELLDYVLGASRVEIRVHPDDFAAAADAHGFWQQRKFGEWDVVIVPDASLSRGGCEIRSEVGRVDARKETRFALLEPLIRELIERSLSADD